MNGMPWCNGTGWLGVRIWVSYKGVGETRERGKVGGERRWWRMVKGGEERRQVVEDSQKTGGEGWSRQMTIYLFHSSRGRSLHCLHSSPVSLLLPPHCPPFVTFSSFPSWALLLNPFTLFRSPFSVSCCLGGGDRFCLGLRTHRWHLKHVDSRFGC